MEWTDAEKALPNERERVLLFTPYSIFGEDYFCVGNRESIKTCTTWIGKKEAPVFTHWMPLPPKPTILRPLLQDTIQSPHKQEKEPHNER